jgi:hypothetical protein
MALSDRAIAAMSRAMDAAGEPIVIRTFSGTTPTETSARARVFEYTPQDLIAGNGIVQGDQKLIVEAAGITTAPKKDDKILFRGKSTTVQAVDSNTRRIAGALIAYEIRVRG